MTGPNPDGAGALRRALSRTTMVPRDVVHDADGDPSSGSATSAAAGGSPPSCDGGPPSSAPSDTHPPPPGQQPQQQPAAPPVARRSVVPSIMVSPFQDTTSDAQQRLSEERQREGAPLLPQQQQQPPPREQQQQRHPSGLPRVPSHDSLNGSAGLRDQRSASLRALQELTAAGPEPDQEPTREARQHTVHWAPPDALSALTVRALCHLSKYGAWGGGSTKDCGSGRRA